MAGCHSTSWRGRTMPRRTPVTGKRRAVTTVASTQSQHLRENQAFDGQTLNRK